MTLQLCAVSQGTSCTFNRGAPKTGRESGQNTSKQNSPFRGFFSLPFSFFLKIRFLFLSLGPFPISGRDSEKGRETSIDGQPLEQVHRGERTKKKQSLITKMFEISRTLNAALLSNEVKPCDLLLPSPRFSQCVSVYVANHPLGCAVLCVCVVLTYPCL